MYHLLGVQVVVYLYNSDGIMVSQIQGRVADVARQVEVAPGLKKDLAYVVDIKTDDEAPFRNSAGTENEGWFAIHDMEVIQDEGPRWFVN